MDIRKPEVYLQGLWNLHPWRFLNLTKQCPKLPVLELNLSPVFTGGWARCHKDLPQNLIFPKICTRLIVRSNWFVTIHIFFISMILYRTLLEGSNFSVSVSVGRNFVHRKWELLLNQQVQPLFVNLWNLAKSNKSPFKKIRINTIYSLTVTYLMSLPELPTSRLIQLWSHFYTNYMKKIISAKKHKQSIIKMYSFKIF